jgi:hypothetical protein
MLVQQGGGRLGEDEARVAGADGRVEGRSSRHGEKDSFSICHFTFFIFHFFHLASGVMVI